MTKLNVKVQAYKASDEKKQTSADVLGILSPAKGKKAQALISKDLPKNLGDYRFVLDQLLSHDEVSGQAGTSCTVRFAADNGGHLIFVALGSDKNGVNAQGPSERLRRLGAAVYRKLEQDKIKVATIFFDSFLNTGAKLSIDPTLGAQSFCEGLGLAAYQFNRYVSKKEEKPAIAITLVTTNSKRVSAFQKGLDAAEAIVLGTEISRDLSNEPSNTLFPASFADQAKKFAAEYGLKCTVMDEKELKKEKMGLLLSVGQGSEKPPRLIVLEYNPKGVGKKTPLFAFVGKGITFDTGGISIKPSAKMEEMKHDMSGAATVLGALVAASQLKLKTRIVGVLACAENMPSGNATCPGHIITARNGKTVEINNTDAEGRLVLADALDWVQDMKPDYIIDLATLTGAVNIALGKGAAGLMANNDALVRALKKASDAVGERVWELPLYEEYFDDLKSDFADMRNSGDSPSHGSSKGGMFLLQFIREGMKWAHLDIASMANNVGGIAYHPRRGATGFGVRLLIELAKTL